MLFKKKPIMVEAIQFVGGYKSFEEILNFVGKICSTDADKNTGECRYIDILTKEGLMTAMIGDWIIKEPFETDDRKFYPCKPDIFAMTYEEV